MILAQVSIAPVGESISVSKYVKVALDVFIKEKIKYETNAMATVLETDNLETLFNVIKKAHNAVIKAGGQRIITEIKIDDRRDKNATIKSKLKSVK